MSTADAIAQLSRAAAELAEIRRAKEFAQWSDHERHRLEAVLSQLEPFRPWRDVFIFTGDGARVSANGRFGDWAIGRLTQRLSAEDILTAFQAELERNSAIYNEVTPLFGVKIDEVCHLADGVTIQPWPAGIIEAFERDLWPTDLRPPPEGTSFLRQTFTVTPAFEKRHDDAMAPSTTALTVPDRQARDVVRDQVRLACLLASQGPVECPLTALRPDRAALFVAGDLNLAERPGPPRPLAPFPVKSVDVKAAYEALTRFVKSEVLGRAINRLGRSRNAASDVDRALELGMSAEIALMYGQGSGNSEVTQKIASRAAWLLGADLKSRTTVFDGMKELYAARSDAVHSGVLKRTASVDLAASDGLVCQVLVALAGHGDFPDWQALVLGDRLEQT